MIRSEVMAWTAILLVILFAFVLMPVHERFVDAQGRQTDVSPDAPPKPEWLKPISETTGKKEGFWGFFAQTRERMTNSIITLQDLANAKKEFYKTLALGETDNVQLMYYFKEEKIDSPPAAMASRPISGPEISQYKLYTSSYKTLAQIAAAVNQPKPTVGRGGADVFLRSAATILFPVTASGSAGSVLGAPTSNMGSAPAVGTGGSSSTCWDTVNPTGGTFFDSGLLMQSFRKGADKWQACDPTGSGMIMPSDTLKKCLFDADVAFFSLDQAKAACVSDSTCSAVLELKNTSGGPGNIYRKYYGSTALSAPTPGGPPVPLGTVGYIKKPCAGSPPTSSLSLLPSPTAPAPRISSTLGVGDPSLSGMFGGYTSGIRPPSGSPWAGLRGLTEMASEVTDPAFQAQTRPNPPLGTLQPTEPEMGLFGPGPNVLRKNLVACTCASQSAGCSAHPQR